MAQTNELLELVRFVNDFDTFERNLKQANIDKEISGFRNFFDNFDAFQISLQDILKNESPYYNIFSILKIRHYEARVHTPFLGHLLDPNESHGQGDIFVRSFLRDQLKLISDPDIVKNVAVYQEFQTKYGRLDLMLECNISGQKKTIVIENKIYHHDGEEQLERYHRYLVEERKLLPSNYLLVYLTVNCTTPTRVSISDELLQELHSTGNIICIGYKENIAPWLRACLSHTKSSNVNTLLEQYIETIKSL